MKQKHKYSVREVMIKNLTGEIFNKTAIDMLQEKVEVKWKPKLHEKYNTVLDDGSITWCTFADDNIDNWRIKTGNCFPYTEDGKKQCEEYKQKLISLGEKK